MIHIDLKDQNILVTGASDGIGNEIASYLMQMGANVGVHFRGNRVAAQGLIDQFPNTNSHIFQADFSKISEVNIFWQEVLDTFKRIDAIVLNAGVFLRHPIENSTEDWLNIWEQTMDINLKSPAILTQLGLSILRNKREEDLFISRAGLSFVEKLKNIWHMRRQRED